MTSDEVCEKLVESDLDGPLKSLNDIAMFISRKTGCSWIEAIAFMRDTLAKAVEKIGDAG